MRLTALNTAERRRRAGEQLERRQTPVETGARPPDRRARQLAAFAIERLQAAADRLARAKRRAEADGTPTSRRLVSLAEADFLDRLREATAANDLAGERRLPPAHVHPRGPEAYHASLKRRADALRAEAVNMAADAVPVIVTRDARDLSPEERERYGFPAGWRPATSR